MSRPFATVTFLEKENILYEFYYLCLKLYENELELGVESVESIKKENFGRRKFGYNKKNGQEK